MRFAGRSVFQRGCGFALRAGLVAAAVAASVRSLESQQLVTDAPVARAGGTAYVGKYTATSVFSAGPTFHFTAPVTITSIAYDSGPGGVQELEIRGLSGCTYGSVTSAGTVCGIETEIASKYPGWRFGTLRVTTTIGAFTVPVEWESMGSQVAVTPGIVSTPQGLGSVTANSIAVDGLGNIYTASADAVIRKISASTGAVTIVAGMLNRTPNANNAGDGGPATASPIQNPVDVATSPAGDIYLVSSATAANDSIRKVNGATGTITTVASITTGRAASLEPVAGPAADGTTAVDDQGNIYATSAFLKALTVTGGDREPPVFLIGKDPASTLAGCNADFAQAPLLLAVSNGFIYFSTASAVYRISTDVSACHAPVLIAGTGNTGNSGDGGLATRAAIGLVTGIAVDAAGDVYLADATNQTVRVVNAATGIISAVAGAGSALQGVTVAGGYASLALDVRGNMYVLGVNGIVQKIDVSASALSFTGNAANSNGGSTKNVVFTNIGNDTLASATPAVSAGFVLDAANGCGVGNATQLAAGFSCVAAVDFVPQTSAPLIGTMSLGGASIALDGNATAVTTTTIGISPTSIDFGNVAINKGSVSWTVSVTNTGASPLRISSLSLNDAKNFVLSSDCGPSVAAHNSCALTVAFKPQTAGAFQAEITLTDNANPSIQTITLSGRAAEAGYSVAVTPNVLTVQQGETGVAQFVFAPTGGFTGAVSFACEGLPAGATCSFAPAKLIADGSDAPQVSVLTVSLQRVSTTASITSGKRAMFASLLGLGGVMLIGMRRKRAFAASLMLLLGLVSLGAAGCGSGGAAGLIAPVRRTTVNVVASSAGSSQSATFELMVK